MARQGHTRVGVFHEEGLIGDEFFAAFKWAARRYGIAIVGDHLVGLFNTLKPVEPQLASVRDAGADAILVLSAYGALAPVNSAFTPSANSGTGTRPAIEHDLGGTDRLRCDR